jgi:hypothetical protein
MPGAMDKHLLFKLRMAPSVIYTVVSAFIKADESYSGGEQ